MPMAIQVPEENLVRAAEAEGWNLSLFGKPKITFTCGNCFHVWATRDWFEEVRKGVSCTCPKCNKVNWTGARYR